eukprot:SAG31_NODE_673_length_12919_cov_143.235725_1_plen_106_part_10
MFDGDSVTGYKIYFRNAVNDSFITSQVAYDGTNSTEEQGTVIDLAGGTLYSFAISALSAAGESPLTPEVALSTAPPAVTGIESVVQTTDSITLAWPAPNITSPMSS